MAFALAPSVLVGQDQEADSSAPSASDSTDVATPMAAALDSVAMLDRVIEFLDQKADSVSGDDARLLADRREVRVDVRRALLWRVAEALADTTDEAATQVQATAIDSLLAEDALVLRSNLTELARRSSNLREELSDLEGPARSRLEAEVRQIDSEYANALRDYHRSLVSRDALGADVSTLLVELDGSLRLQAEFLAARMATTEKQISEVRERIAQGEADLQTRVSALGLRSTSEKRALEAVLEVMESRDLATADFRRFLLVTTGDLTAENISFGVLGSIVSDWIGDGIRWLRQNGANVAFKTLVFFAVLIVAWVGARVVRRLLGKAVTGPRVHLSSLAREMIVRWASRFVLMLGVLIALSQVGVDLGPVLAGFGVAGFIVAFALQETLSNFAAGMMILLYRPFDVGDVVDVAGASGKISNMSLVSTTVLSPDNQRFVVPNNKIWGDVIRNVTSLDTRRVDLVFGVGYDDDLEKAQDVLRDVVEGHELVLDSPEPVIKVSNLGESSVDFIARPWCKTDDYWDVYWDLTRMVKTRFDEEGISIPFPQRDVHVFGAEANESEKGSDPSEASANGSEARALAGSSEER